MPIFRRSSGGGTVLIGPGTLNVTVILPETAGPGLSAVDAAQHHVLDRLARSIRRAGAPVDVLAHGDLVLGDRKCGGSASAGSSDGSWSIARSSTGSRSIGSPAISPCPPASPTIDADVPTPISCATSTCPARRWSKPSAPARTRAPAPDPASALRGPMAILPSLLAERFANPEWIERL